MIPHGKQQIAKSHAQHEYDPVQLLLWHTGQPTPPAMFTETSEKINSIEIIVKILRNETRMT